MHNTKGDFTLTNISRETNYFQDLVQYLEKGFFAFAQPQYVLRLGMFILTFRQFGYGLVTGKSGECRFVLVYYYLYKVLHRIDKIKTWLHSLCIYMVKSELRTDIICKW